jgi:hypothetical protein
VAKYRSSVCAFLIVIALGATRAYGITSGLNLGSALQFAAPSSQKPVSLAKDAP